MYGAVRVKHIALRQFQDIVTALIIPYILIYFSVARISRFFEDHRNLDIVKQNISFTL